MSDLAFGIICGTMYGIYLVFAFVILTILHVVLRSTNALVVLPAEDQRWAHAEDYSGS